ncbi:MAG: SAM-dependent methyltransferase [Planctomycetaceae bacterium]|nr:SAM-dependent methyltransferase [Planctomycetaceae bacterium]
MSASGIDVQQKVAEFLQQGDVQRVLLSGVRAETTDLPQRISVRPVLIRDQLQFQVTQEFPTDHQHQNLTAEKLQQLIRSHFPQNYRNLHLDSQQSTTHFRASRKGKLHCTVNRMNRPAADTSAAANALEHNRRRSYLIPDGTPCPFLIETGVMTVDGRVRAQHFQKFRQINRYLEFIQDALKHLPDGNLQVLDFGCGKSYLTFATHHLLTSIQQRSCQITGLDRRPDVVDTCRRITDALQLQGLRFDIGEIAGFVPTAPIDLAISLHACDTATDLAIATAVRWQCPVILAVPCCQHELAAQLPRTAVPILSRHGILHERYASMVTDGMRAALLTAAGYETSVIEFIDMEHTPKNLLIRAVRPSVPLAESVRREALRQVVQLRAHLRIEPLCLERQLTASGLSHVLPDSDNSELTTEELSS